MSSYDTPEGRQHGTSATGYAEDATPDTFRRVDPETAMWSDTIRDTSAPEAKASIGFSWPTTFISDCKLGGNNLSIFSDGSAVWRATVMSFGGGDAWLSTFEFFDNHGISLRRFGRISSPSLSPPGAVIDWVSNNQLFFPAYLFPHISQATMRSHC
jgi:Family of unknown function (DUF6294)